MWASDLPFNAVQLSSHNAEASCHKHFIVISREQQTPLLTAMSVTKLPWSGAAVCITLGSQTINSMR